MTVRTPPRQGSRVLLLCLLAAILLAWTACDALGQERERRKIGQKIDCYTCRDAGLVPCEDHQGAAEWCLEHSFFCTECMQTLSCCRGRGLTPCECVEGDWENLIDDPGYELFQGCIDSQQELVEFIKSDPIYAVTEHFLVMSTLEGLKLTPGEAAELSAEIGDLRKAFPWLFRSMQNITPHAMVHLYAHRLEKIYATYCSAIGLTVEEDRGVHYSSRRTNVYLAGTNKEKSAWQARHNGASLTSGSSGEFILSQQESNQGGRNRRFSGPNVAGDRNFHDGVIHLSSRCLIDRYFCAGGGKYPPGWLKIGFPHWMEWEILTQCSYYLVNIEVRGLADEWIVSDWDKRAVSMARRADYGTTSFPLLSKKDYADMGYKEHVLSWSYVDFLVDNEPREKFRKYWDKLRSRIPPRDSLLDAYGWSELTLENRWRSKLLFSEDEFEGLTQAERFVAEFDRSRNHPDLETRASAAYYLKFCNDMAAAERILQAFQEGEILVRASALEALQTFENPEAVRWVVENGLSHSSPSVRRNTAVAMGTFPGLAEITVPLLIKLLGDTKAAVRAGAVRALGELHPDEAYLPLAGLASDRDPEVRVELALALWNYKRDDALTEVLTLLRDPVWPVRLAAVRALHNVQDKRIIPALIDQLGREGGRLREDIRDLLVAVTHQDFQLNIEKWTWWWNNYGGQFQFGTKPSKSLEHKMRYAIQYHDVDTSSKKFVFLLDVSSSMNEIIQVEKQAGKTYGEGDLTKKKINVAQTELVRLLRTFDRNIIFNIITFNQEIEIWRKAATPATKDTVKKAEKFVWDIKPPDKAATNVYDSLMAAFDMVDEAFAKRKYDSTVDTMFFLSDGNPTAGPVTDVDMILRVVKERNRIHGVKIHTFALGGSSGDTHFCRRLAEMTGGEYQVIRVR